MLNQNGKLSCSYWAFLPEKLVFDNCFSPLACIYSEYDEVGGFVWLVLIAIHCSSISTSFPPTTRLRFDQVNSALPGYIWDIWAFHVPFIYQANLSSVLYLGTFTLQNETVLSLCLCLCLCLAIMTFFGSYDKIWKIMTFLAVMITFNNLLFDSFLSWILVVSIFQWHEPQKDPKIKTNWNKKYDNSFNFIIGVCKTKIKKQKKQIETKIWLFF